MENRDMMLLSAAGANTPNEKAITIGAGQWYAVEAKRLLQEIQRADPAQFKRLDAQGIADDLLHKNWSNWPVSPAFAKAKCMRQDLFRPPWVLNLRTS